MKLLRRAAISTLTLASLAWAGTLPGEKPQSQAAGNGSASSSAYVGADTCKTCHEEEFKSVHGTPHSESVLKLKGAGEAHSCETCHGPGAAHVEGGGDVSKIIRFPKLSTAEADKRCLSCHQTGSLEHINFERSSHAKNDVGCLSCHSAHHAKAPQFLLSKAQPGLCYGCHSPAKADFSKPFRHRVDQHLIECSDCHNPHGTFGDKQLRTARTQQQVCVNCHVEKQGPFAFEHVPVKTERCESCHTPHGSTNPRMLRVSQVNLLCLQCHSAIANSGIPGTPSFHNQAQKYQACTMCHTQIHGSNFNEFFFK
jgi:DmsE family decaheme c-type cytochrome